MEIALEITKTIIGLGLLMYLATFISCLCKCPSFISLTNLTVQMFAQVRYSTDVLLRKFWDWYTCIDYKPLSINYFE